MGRRLNREDLEVSNPLFSKNHALFSRFTWSVYEGYELVGGREEEGHLRASKGAKIRRRYEPLTDTPRLFLEFARLHEDETKAPGGGAVREWIHKRGLLGLHENSEKGGVKETWRDVVEEVLLANALLTLYEAVLSNDLEQLKRPFDPESGFLEPEVLPFLASELRPIETEQTSEVGDNQQMPQEGSERTQEAAGMERIHYIQLEQLDNFSLDDLSTGDLIARCMRHVIVAVQSKLALLVRPSFGTLAPLVNETQRMWWTPEQLTRSWLPVNLLGAMYLQFYWLLTSAGELSRCKFCGGIVSHAPPIPERANRKPRKDKEFCSRQCRQNHHYQTRVKPARKGKRA